MAQACWWDQNEKLFRLNSCLRGNGDEYAFGQLRQDTLDDFSQLERLWNLDIRRSGQVLLMWPSWKMDVCK